MLFTDYPLRILYRYNRRTRCSLNYLSRFGAPFQGHLQLNPLYFFSAPEALFKRFLNLLSSSLCLSNRIDLVLTFVILAQFFLFFNAKSITGYNFFQYSLQLYNSSIALFAYSYSIQNRLEVYFKKVICIFKEKLICFFFAISCY